MVIVLKIMPTKIAALLQELGERIGLGSELQLSDEKTIRLNLEEDFAIDFKASYQVRN